MKYTLTRDNISNTLNTLKKFKGVLIGHIGINGHTDGLSNNVYDPEISFDSYGGVNGIKINVNYTIYFGDEVEVEYDEIRSHNALNVHKNNLRIIFI